MSDPSPAKGIDVLVQDAIRHARSVRPGCTVREAAEITAGRRLNDAEWQRKAPIWLRNWDGDASAETDRPSAVVPGSVATPGARGRKWDASGGPRSVAVRRSSASTPVPGPMRAGTPRARSAA